jgi:hypothetical protein
MTRPSPAVTGPGVWMRGVYGPIDATDRVPSR